MTSTTKPNLLSFPNAAAEEQLLIQEAASAGLKSLSHLISVLSSQQQSYQSNHHQQQLDCREITDFTVSKFKKVISMLNRTGHARFRRGPTHLLHPHPQPRVVPPIKSKFETESHFLSQANSIIVPPVQSKPKSVTLDFTKPNTDVVSATSQITMSSTNSSFMSSITGDGSVSNGKQGSSLFVAPAPAVSSGKPPLASSSATRKRCHEHEHGHDHRDDVSGKIFGSGGKCHCSKRRKSKMKKSVRVPAISSKIADIPPDEYSWRKYGQKPIKGSPHPRGYYKCSSVRGCPAKKHVERALDDPTMLIVTYESEHRHTKDPSQEIFPGGVGLVFQST